MGIADEDLRADLEILRRQEDALRFGRFDAETAWELGSRLRDSLLARGTGATIEIEVHDQLLFACATQGAKVDQVDWIRRKRNSVHHFKRSTYALGRELALAGQTLEEADDLREADYAAHGGGFPLWLSGQPDSCVGSVVLSGLPQREDHNLVVAAIAGVLRVVVPLLA